MEHTLIACFAMLALALAFLAFLDAAVHAYVHRMPRTCAFASVASLVPLSCCYLTITYML